MSESTSEKVSVSSAPRTGIGPAPVPLSVWGVGLFLLSLSFCYFYQEVMADVPPSGDFTRYNARRLAKLAQKPNHLKVVIFGDSRLRYGTFTGDDLSRKLEERAGMSVDVIRLAKDIATLKDFRYLQEQVFALQPDLILVQEDLLTKVRPFHARLFFAREYLASTYFGKYEDDPGSIMRQKAFHKEMRCEALSGATDVEERKQRFLKWSRFAKAGERAADADVLLRQSSELEIPLMALAIPISPGGQGVVPAPPSELVLRVAKPDLEMSNSNYCDVVHMNESGRELYSEWLLDFLERELTMVGL